MFQILSMYYNLLMAKNINNIVNCPFEMGKSIISYMGNIAHLSYSLKTAARRDHSVKRVNKANILLSFQNESLLF